MGDDLQRDSEALGVPTPWLLVFVLVAFITLLLAVVTRDAAVAGVAAASAC